MLIAEFGGTVLVWQNDTLLPTPFIDLTDEVGTSGDRGLLGIAVDPDFELNGYVYLLYTVDEFFGEPDELASSRTFARLTRYAADPNNDFNTALLASRLVLIGQNPDEGFPSCSSSHTIGTLTFGFDGGLFVGAGDGAHFEFMDDGGADPSCFLPDDFPGFGQDQDIGSFAKSTAE